MEVDGSRASSIAGTDRRIRELERFVMRFTWWIVALSVAGSLVLGGVVNLFIDEVSLAYSLAELSIAILILGLYLRSVRRIEAILERLPGATGIDQASLSAIQQRSGHC